jgi:hypothetical protein
MGCHATWASFNRNALDDDALSPRAEAILKAHEQSGRQRSSRYQRLLYALTAFAILFIIGIAVMLRLHWGIDF